MSVSWSYFLCGLLPIESKEQRIVSHAEDKLNIVRLIKKLKVAARNLEKNGFKP